MTRTWKWLAPVTLIGLCACATDYDSRNLAFVTDRNLEHGAANRVLSPAGQKCRIVFTKRVGYILFHLPFNEMTQRETNAALSVEKGEYSVRYRELIYPADVGLTILGFLVSIITKTKQIEVCPAVPNLASSEETKKLLIFSRFEEERKRLAPLNVPIGFETGALSGIRHKVYTKGDPENLEEPEVIVGTIVDTGSTVRIATEGVERTVNRNTIVAVEVLIPE